MLESVEGTRVRLRANLERDSYLPLPARGVDVSLPVVLGISVTAMIESGLISIITGLPSRSLVRTRNEWGNPRPCRNFYVF
jgi:hypothetical protein